MTSDKPEFLWGWGKTNRRRPTDPAFEWLSLIDHSLDVAATLRCLVEEPYSRTVEALFRHLDDSLIDDLTILAGLHDLGKVSWTFQGMQNGPTPLTAPFSYIHHSDEACALLLDQQRDAIPTLAAALRPAADLESVDDRALLRTAFSHHGKPRNGKQNLLDQQRDLDKRLRPSADDRFDPLAVVRALVSKLPLRSADGPLSRLQSDEERWAALHNLMGLINLADWIGSSAHWFPLRPSRGEDFDRREAARRAMNDIGWPSFAIGHADDEAAIHQTLALYTNGRARQLRPVQALAVEALLAAPPRPGDTLVLEEETGGGKTLTAYLIHALLARRGLVTGLTFCLPTRASARAIHEGACRVYGGRFAPVLAVPGYDEAMTSPLPAEAHANDLSWAARSRHRFLAAPVAVGTIDQVLLGTLPVRYAHLRAIAPARNLLVVDEVHASDLYMRGLLREVVARRRRQGGITLLMSATLGAELRAELLEPPATRSRSRRPRPSSAPLRAASPAPYPVLWRTHNDPVELAAGGKDKQVRVVPDEAWSLESVGNVAQRALTAARAGGRVLVIRNTVALARATAAALVERDPRCLLCLNNHAVCHHARYAAADRTALDAVLLSALHPDPLRRASAGVVAITTQTAEQSLDVDADLLITDLVPADVLLQRVGRLHRNRDEVAQSARPDGFKTAECLVLTPTNPGTLLSFARAPGRGPNNWGTDRAYADTLSLAATRELIGRGVVWHIPSDSRQLVEAATASSARGALAERFGEVGAEAARRSSARAMFEGERARVVRWSDCHNPARNDLCEAFDTRAGGEAATRLGLSDIRLELHSPFPSPFGDWSIGALTIPGHIAQALHIRSDHFANWTASDRGISLRLEDHGARFIYTPFGLDVLR